MLPVADAQCPACNSSRWIYLPVHPHVSMLSDGRVVSKRLAKRSCLACGLVAHVEHTTRHELAGFFDDRYRLATKPIGDKFQRVRQRHYAQWIVDVLGGRRISSIFEIGAGNGSLLAELVELYPGLQVSGIEPVDAAAEFARSAGLDIQTAFIEAFDITSANSDVVLSVNVVEHVVDPVAFLATAATGMSENGCIIVVCPDGEIPSTELLIYDHVHSFTPRAMRLLAAKCGLAVTDVRKSPGEIGPFQALVLQRESTTPSVGSLETDSILHRERNAFLGAWEALERRLLARVNKTKTLTAFGFGESAQLLRTYAPNVWAKVDNIVADVDGFFDDKIVHRYRPDLTVAQEILLAVRPDLQPALVERLRGDGKHPIQWDDLVFIGHSV